MKSCASGGKDLSPLPTPKLSEPDRAWLIGWGIATLSMKRMQELDVASWLRHLMRLPIRDSEVAGMVEALLSSGVDWSLGAENEVQRLQPPTCVEPQ